MGSQDLLDTSPTLICRYLSTLTPTPISYGLLIIFSLIRQDYPMSLTLLYTWSNWVYGIIYRQFYCYCTFLLEYSFMVESQGWGGWGVVGWWPMGFQCQPQSPRFGFRDLGLGLHNMYRMYCQILLTTTIKNTLLNSIVIINYHLKY